MQIHTKSRSKVTGASPGLAFHLFVFLHVPDLDLTLKVTKSCQNQDVTLRTKDQKEKNQDWFSSLRSLVWPLLAMVRSVLNCVLTCSRQSFVVQFQSQIPDRI